MAKRDETQEDLSPEESLRQLARLARLMRGLSHENDLNPAQWEALRYLAHADVAERTPGRLARYVGATKGTISQTIAALEKKGLISKHENSADNRSVALALTEQGGSRLANDPMGPLAQVIAELKPKTRKRFDRAVAELIAAFNGN